MSKVFRNPASSLLRLTAIVSLLACGLSACGKSEPQPPPGTEPAPAAETPAASAPAAPAQDPNDPTSRAGTTTVPGETSAADATSPGAAAAAAGIGGAAPAAPTGPVTPVPPMDPIQSTPALAAEGKKLFMSAGCNACHGGTGGGGMCPPLTNTTWVYGSDDATLHALIKEGTAGMAGHGLTRIGKENVVGQMPPFGPVLKDEEIDKILAFIHSINKTAGQKSAGTK